MDRKEISKVVFRPNFLKIGLFGLKGPVTAEMLSVDIGICMCYTRSYILALQLIKLVKTQAHVSHTIYDYINGSFLLTNISQAGIEIRARITNYIHVKQRRLKSATTFDIKPWLWILIHAALQINIHQLRNPWNLGKIRCNLNNKVRISHMCGICNIVSWCSD